ncbi:MAG: MBL fold metallo-hydrolase [Clostridia bacterium]|nr:MBL fold metallo-hydrolase [Clostridia bacterium]
MKMRKTITALLISFMVVSLVGCGSTKPVASASPSAASATVQATESATPTPTPTPEPVDLNKNDTGKTIIRTYSGNATYPSNSYMIISSQGTVVCTDPTSSVDGVKPDAITSTHNHPDHIDYKLEQKFPDAKISHWKTESFEVKDFKITGIASKHMGDTIMKAYPDNVIYVYEVDGLRIAHMGDIGQTQLTEDQLKELGKIDIAFMQFVNSYSAYSLANEKGFKVIEQLKPQIIIPTHSTKEATEKIGQIVGAYESVDDVLVISKDDLKDGKRKVIEIKNTLNK